MRNQLLHSCPELIDYINEVGFLPLLRMGVAGWSAEEVMDEDCQYTKLPDGGWEWPLWSWKGPILQDTGCAYGKFFDRKAAFISREWWPDFCNYRRSLYPYPEEGSVEESILFILKRHGSLITRELRAACGFTGGREYGWGWSLLTTPETLFGREACHPGRTPQESYERLLDHFRKILPDEPDKRLMALLK